MKHTPTPWHIGKPIQQGVGVFAEPEMIGADPSPILVAACSANQLYIRRTPEENEREALANAAFIVRACNSHEELLELVRAIAARIEGNFDNPALVKRGPLAVHMLDDIHNWAKQAIAKAEGRTA